MTDDNLSRSLRVRSYREAVRDAGRTFHVVPGEDMRATLKRSALAAVPKVEGWTMRVFTVERTRAGERVAALLDHLARRAMGGSDFAAALAATLDGTCAVLAVAAKDPQHVEGVSSLLSRAGG